MLKNCSLHLRYTIHNILSKTAQTVMHDICVSTLLPRTVSIWERFFVFFSRIVFLFLEALPSECTHYIPLLNFNEVIYMIITETSI